jgi:TolB-like protein/class 3 adenylate cyclase/AraC-like DNA-binding protein
MEYPMKEEKVRRLAAVMFTDIVGYTALMQEDEEVALRVRAKHREVFLQQHTLHQGEIIQYYGDGALSVFKSALEAAECAIEIQRLLKEGEPVPVRIGLHMGDIVFDKTEVYGDGVNFASRIESMGVAGAILLSGKLNDELKNHTHISTISLGRFGLKNIAEPVEVFAVTNEGVTVPKPSELGGKRSRQTKSIAVLPFVNLSSNEENEYFSDGMTEEIISALSKIKSLKVTSRTSSFFFKNKKIPVPQIGKELNVSAILEGSIRLSGNRMRIKAQLIDVADDFHFWSETFDRSMDDIFAVQDEISLLIADKLREHLGHFEIEDHLVDAPEVPVEIYKRYLKSRYHLLKMHKSDIEKGLSILDGIIQEQPDFPLAYLGVHLGYTLLGTIGLEPASEAFAKGKPFLDKAIELNPNLAESQIHLAWISFLQNWDLAATYRHINKALEIRPEVDFYQTMASTLVAEAKYKAALHYIETALQLDPFSAINYHLKGFIFYAQERYEEAIELFEKGISLKSDAQVSILYLGQALILQGRAPESLAFFQKLPDNPGDLLKLGGTTLAQAALGHTDLAKTGIETLESALGTEQMERALNLLILCRTMTGEHEAAINLIELGVNTRLPMMVYLSIEPILNPLHSIPRFHELMGQILGERTSFEGEKRKYKKSLLQPDLLNKYQDQLTQLMSREKPYLNPDLALRDLAEMLGIPPNQLSQVLNEGFDQNFAEFVNSYRLEMFKSKVADPDKRHLTILALAYESGFNSKTVFNTFFKKMTGQTPKAYWKSVVG